MVTIEKHEERADSRREKQQSVFAESIGMEQTSAITHTNLVLLFLAVSIKRREIDVGRGAVLTNILV